MAYQCEDLDRLFLIVSLPYLSTEKHHPLPFPSLSSQLNSPSEAFNLAGEMAALQQSSVAFQIGSTPPPVRAIRPKVFAFSTFNVVKVPSLTSKTLTKRRRGGGGALGARMADNAAESYATALAEVAKSNGSLESTCSDIEKIDKVFSEPGVVGFFVNPVISVEKKRAVLDSIVKDTGLLPHTVNFLNILIDMNRIDIVGDIVKEFEMVYNKLTNTETAVVTSVVPLENQHLAQIAKQVQKLTGAKNVRIKTVIDPSIVAGFIVRYGIGGSKLIDMSVKKQLEEIAAELDLGDIQLVGQ